MTFAPDGFSMSPNDPSTRPMDVKRFSPLTTCWVCECADLVPVSVAHFALSQFEDQDPDLSKYTGCALAMRRCAHCGFIQPEGLPTLAGYFDRIYDQHWPADWVREEFESTYKDFIFRGILQKLESLRQQSVHKTILDIGAHAGRFIHLASLAGWQAEGIELNPRTAAFAQERTGLKVHRISAAALSKESDKRYGVVTLTDVLEHIPDPLRILRTVGSLLEPNGWLAVKVPCGPNQIIKDTVRARLAGRKEQVDVAENLVHINHFNPKSLLLALKRSGFRRVVLSIGAPELQDLRSRPSARARFSNLFRRTVYETARILPGGVHTPLALNLQAFAQKA